MACKYSDWTRGEDEALLNIVGGSEVARKVLRQEVVLKVVTDQQETPLFSLADSSIPIPALLDAFVVKDHFKKGNSGIVYLGENFQKCFGGQTVASRNGLQLRSHRLNRGSHDWKILAEIDGCEETDLAAVFHFISLQPKGGQGVLLSNGYANIFYVRDVNSELRAVSVFWCGGGWACLCFSGCRSV